MRAKLGLVREEEGDDRLIGDLLALMAKARADYTLSFRKLTAEDRDWLALFGCRNADAEAWLSRYRVRTESEDLSGHERASIPNSCCATGWRKPPSARWKIRAMSGRWTASSAFCRRRLKSMTATKLLPRRRHHPCAIWK